LLAATLSVGDASRDLASKGRTAGRRELRRQEGEAEDRRRQRVDQRDEGADGMAMQLDKMTLRPSVVIRSNARGGDYLPT
jgi:hypothetical protein